MYILQMFSNKHILQPLLVIDIFFECLPDDMTLWRSHLFQLSTPEWSEMTNELEEHKIKQLPPIPSCLAGELTSQAF